MATRKIHLPCLAGCFYTRLLTSERKGIGVIRLRVRELAEQRDVSMTRLSHLAVLDIKVIRKMFREPTASFTTYALDKVAKALGVPFTEIFEVVPDE